MRSASLHPARRALAASVRPVPGCVFVLCALLALTAELARGADEPVFRVQPYLQNPTPTSITIRWLTPTDRPGELRILSPDKEQSFTSTPVRATALVPNPFGPEPGSPRPEAPWLHSLTVTDLQPGTSYAYRVTQPSAAGESTTTVQLPFKTAPSGDAPVRFMVYSDSETEPESSTVPPVDWPVGPGSNRPQGQTKYLVDQTRGYRENLMVMARRTPDLILVTGDLVESGGEQRDWDEFWRHNAGDLGFIAGHVPLLPALGNHENFGGPGAFGGYSAAAANFGVAKFLTYFSVPDNGATNPVHRGRYYRVDYGPIAFITVDSSDGLPANTVQDTNHNLADSHAPDFNPGSEQYLWLERQLADAQKSKRFTFVQYHHTAYGSGPHSVPFGAKGFQDSRAGRCACCNPCSPGTESMPSFPVTMNCSSAPKCPSRNWHWMEKRVPGHCTFTTSAWEATACAGHPKGTTIPGASSSPMNSRLKSGKGNGWFPAASITDTSRSTCNRRAKAATPGPRRSHRCRSSR